MATGLQLKVFLAGRVAVETDGVVIDDAHFVGRQGRLLFAYLVAEQGRPVPRDELAEALWGDAPPATWDKALTVIVSKLRALLADSGIDGAHTLTGAFGCYRLDLPEGTWVDVVVAANAAREAEEALAAGDLKQAKAGAALAESLVRQPFLPGEDGTWVEEKRRELTDVRDCALNALADVCLRSGEPQEAVKWAEQTVALAPFRETGYRRLMEAHAAAGNRAEALRVYERCRRLLAEELGTYPSPETESIYRGLLEAPPARAGAAAAPDAPSPDEDSLANRQREAAAGHAAASPPTRRRLRLGVAIAAVLCAATAVVAVTLGKVHGGAPAPIRGNAIAIVDATTPRRLGSVPLDSRPAAIAYGAGSIWVSYPDARWVARISPSARRVVASIPLDRPAQGLAATSRSLWAVGSSPTDTALTLDQIDPTFDTVARVRRLPMVVAGDSGSIAAERDTVVVAPRAGYLTRIDARSGRTLSRIDPNVAPTAVAQGFGSSWLAYREADLVVRIDETTGFVTTIPVGRGPAAVTVGRRAVWVADALDGTVKSIDPATSSVVTTVEVGSAPSAIAQGDGSIWVANAGDGTLTRIDERTSGPTARVAVGGSPQALVVAEGKVWVSVQPPPAAEPTGGTLVVSVPRDITVFDPAFAQAIDDDSIVSAICSTLLTYPDEPGLAGLQLVPDAARAAPTVSDGGRSYTFVIRPGLRFSPPSNELVTAETFKHTIERSLSPRKSMGLGGSGPGQQELPDVVGAAAYMAGKAEHIAGISARGDRLTIRVTHPAPDLPKRLATSPFCAVPSNMPLRYVSSPFPSAGPYYIAAAIPRRSLVLLRNPNYHGDRPRRPQRIDVVIGPQHPIEAVEGSRLDYAIDGVPADRSAGLERLYGTGSPAARRGEQQYFVVPRSQVDMIRLNTSRPLFANTRMRHAANYAVDRQALAANGGSFYAHATVAQMYLPPGVPGFRDEHTYPLRPDVAAARRLAGPGRHTAVLYCYLGGGSPRAAQIIVKNLAAIGIDVQVTCFPGDQFWTRMLKPGAPWDLAVDGGSGDPGDPGDYLDGYASREVYDASHLNDPRVDSLLASAARKSGLARALAYARVDHVLVRDAAPAIAFANESTHDFFSARIGCQLEAAGGGIDLGALCIRTGRGAAGPQALRPINPLPNREGSAP
jgi:SARP family transcriptional regulator, regulator of embCAB operon